MVGRPKTRVAVLGPERLRLLKEVFGSSLHAYRVLTPYMAGTMGYAVFRRVWDSKPERSEVVTEADAAFRGWASRQLDAILAA